MRKTKPHQQFQKIYDETYDDVLKFVICRCANLDDVNDIIQETYVEFWHAQKKPQQITHPKSFIFGIAKNKLKKHYRLKSKIQKLFSSKTIDDEIITNTLPDSLHLENHIAAKLTTEQIWQYLDTKNPTTTKIFYLYHAENLKIKEIAQELNLNESTIKNHLYRTQKELTNLFGKDN